MRFIDIIEHAKKLGYKVDQQDHYYKIYFETNNSLQIKLRFPDDTIDENLDDFVNVDWEYLIQSGNEKLHSEWFDYYNGNAETKLQTMRKDILKYIDDFATKKAIIIEKSGFTFLGKKYLKHKELVFE